jgi:hypothetical protein
MLCVPDQARLKSENQAVGLVLDQQRNSISNHGNHGVSLVNFLSVDGITQESREFIRVSVQVRYDFRSDRSTATNPKG